MMKNKRTEILIETRERTMVRWLENKITTACHGCGEQQNFILPEHAAIETGTSVREVVRLVETGDLHFLETVDGLLMICEPSLSAMATARR